MDVKILKECGYEEAVLGFSLSYNSPIERAIQILPKYAFGVPGENKFLESIIIWLDVTAPRFLWSEMDTYRLSSKQSESTMHTIKRRELSQEDFEYPINEKFLEQLNIMLKDKNTPLAIIKNNLPEGFLQRRIWCMSYKTFQNIYNQRKEHRLLEWRYFVNYIVNNIQHPEFIIKQGE